LRQEVGNRGPFQSFRAANKAGLATLPPQAPPFMWLARSPEILGSASSVILVQHSLSVLHPCELHLEVFLVGPLASVLAIADSPLLTFCPTRTFHPVRPAADVEVWTCLRRLALPVSPADSREVCCPSSVLEWGLDEHLAGLPHPSTQRSQVFSTSQRFLLPQTFPALFRAGDAPGVRTCRAFPLPESGTSLDARSPPDVTEVVG
jgi:hypothetical protein